MDYIELLVKICSDCTTKEQAIKRLVRFKMINHKGIKYWLIHQFFMNTMRQGYGIPDALTITSLEFNISERQINRVRRYWKESNIEV